MDVFHRVLIKLYDATGGKESEAVDLKDLVKKEGFLGNYPQIKDHLSRQSWISETSRLDTVQITHWGVSEAKKAQTSGGVDDSQAIKKEINKTIASTKELVIFLDELANDVSEENIEKAEKKLGEINSAIQNIKLNV